MLDRFRSLVAKVSTLTQHLPTRSQALAALKVAALWSLVFACSAIVARAVATKADPETIAVCIVGVAVGVFAFEIHDQKATPVVVSASAAPVGETELEARFREATEADVAAGETELDRHFRKVAYEDAQRYRPCWLTPSGTQLGLMAAAGWPGVASGTPLEVSTGNSRDAADPPSST